VKAKVAKSRQQPHPLLADFPVIMEKGKPKAFVVDVEVFRLLQVMVDNLINQNAEPEDALLATSEAFHRLLSQVEAEDETPATHWRRELHAI